MRAFGIMRAVLLLLLVASMIFVGSGVVRAGYQMYLTLRYPLSYQDQIMACQQEFGLDPSYVAAVIYEESRFNPAARSHQNAIGLMQIQPETGHFIAQKLNDGAFTEQALSDASVNIRYGCYYLSYLMDRYGVRDHALAAYNAGPGTVDGWLAQDDYQISFTETSQFVARVAQSELMYRDLYFASTGVEVSSE